ncbi:hypothetical protein AB0D30_30970 [Streptomyces sp. NPDC048409]|uniref:hypothetical protein n=1 Tax=Streptomyces sp. NPDC048409 TaxID=3154723 RepID=UPI00342B13B5
MTSPWLGMPVISATSLIYTIAKDLNAQPTIQRKDNPTITTIPESLVGYIDYSDSKEYAFNGQFYTHTRFKKIQSHLHLDESVGALIGYRMRFTTYRLDKRRQIMAMHKEFETQGKRPEVAELQKARKDSQKVEEQIRRLRAQVKQNQADIEFLEKTRRMAEDAKKRGDNSTGILQKIGQCIEEMRRIAQANKGARNEIMELELNIAASKDVVRAAKQYTSMSDREEQIKTWSRRWFISDFTFELVEPQKFSTGLKGNGEISITSVRSVQSNAKVSVNFTWTEQQYLGNGHSWAGTIQAQLNENGFPEFNGTGKFYERFRETFQIAPA